MTILAWLIRLSLYPQHYPSVKQALDGFALNNLDARKIPGAQVKGKTTDSRWPQLSPLGKRVPQIAKQKKLEKERRCKAREKAFLIDTPVEPGKFIHKSRPQRQ